MSKELSILTLAALVLAVFAEGDHRVSIEFNLSGDDFDRYKRDVDQMRRFAFAMAKGQSPFATVEKMMSQLNPSGKVADFTHYSDISVKSFTTERTRYEAELARIAEKYVPAYKTAYIQLSGLENASQLVQTMLGYGHQEFEQKKSQISTNLNNLKDFAKKLKKISDYDYEKAKNNYEGVYFHNIKAELNKNFASIHKRLYQFDDISLLTEDIKKAIDSVKELRVLNGELSKEQPETQFSMATAERQRLESRLTAIEQSLDVMLESMAEKVKHRREYNNKTIYRQIITPKPNIEYHEKMKNDIRRALTDFHSDINRFKNYKVKKLSDDEADREKARLVKKQVLKSMKYMYKHMSEEIGNSKQANVKSEEIFKHFIEGLKIGQKDMPHPPYMMNRTFLIKPIDSSQKNAFETTVVVDYCKLVTIYPHFRYNSVNFSRLNIMPKEDKIDLQAVQDISKAQTYLFSAAPIGFGKEEDKKVAIDTILKGEIPFPLVHPAIASVKFKTKDCTLYFKGDNKVEVQLMLDSISTVGTYGKIYV